MSVQCVQKESIKSENYIGKDVAADKPPVVLVGSAIKQDSEILKEFLLPLSELDLTGITVDFLFIDDNNDDSSQILQSFSLPGSKVTIVDASSILGNSMFPENYSNHNWNPRLIERVTRLKNYIIDMARSGNYTNLFLIDSDLILHPQTLKRLIASDKHIVANIFWTRWRKNEIYQPQVWFLDEYLFFDDPSDPGFTSSSFRFSKKAELLEMLKGKDVFRVGGLGACTLISRAVLEAGVNFNRIYNVSFWGEDRAFCIRAVVAGFELFVDTHYPAYHIYRHSLLDGVADFKKNGFNFNAIEELTLKEKYRMLRHQAKISWKIYTYRLKSKIKNQSRF